MEMDKENSNTYNSNTPTSIFPTKKSLYKFFEN